MLFDHTKDAENYTQVGEKVIFSGVPKFYYPHFINMRDRAEKLLELNKEYIVKEVRVYSSWCSISLEGLEGEETNFNLSFFTWRKSKPKSN